MTNSQHTFVPVDPLLPVLMSSIQADGRLLCLVGAESTAYKQDWFKIQSLVSSKTYFSDEQIAATLNCLYSKSRVSVINCPPIVGAPYLIFEVIKEVYEDAGFDVMASALSWSASQILGEIAQVELENRYTLSSLKRFWEQSREQNVDPFQRPTLLIVDETNLDRDNLAFILEETSRSNYPFKVVFTGNSLEFVTQPALVFSTYALPAPPFASPSAVRRSSGP